MLRNVAIGVLCLAAGGVGAALHQQLTPAQSSGSAAPAPSLVRSERTIILERNDPRGRPAMSATAEPSANGETVFPPEASETVEEANDRVQAEHHEYESRFEEERIDPAWAPLKQEAISGKLAELSERRGGFSVKSVECQTTVCRGTVTFPGRQEALQGWRQVLHMPTGCASHLLVGDGEGEPFDLDVYYDCEGERAKD